MSYIDRADRYFFLLDIIRGIVDPDVRHPLYLELDLGIQFSYFDTLDQLRIGEET